MSFIGRFIHWLTDPAPDYRLPYVSMHRLKDGGWCWDVYFADDRDSAGIGRTFCEAWLSVCKAVEGVA